MGQIRHGNATTTHAERGIWDQLENGGEVAEASDCRGSEDRPQRAAFNDSVRDCRRKALPFRRHRPHQQVCGNAACRRTAWEFPEYLLHIVPCRVHTIPTDNGIRFTEQPRNRGTAWSRSMRFDMTYEANGIGHRLTKLSHPWTNGQIGRMNRTIREATVKRFHKIWTSEPEKFIINPTQQITGLNI